MTGIIPVILSGGSGSRLWPLSRASKPKQFLSFAFDHTLFQQAVLRCADPVFDQRPIVVGAQDHRFLIAENLIEIGISAEILLEPRSRNTCMAIACGCLHAASRNPESLVLALAADHHIPDKKAFAETVAAAKDDALADNLVAFGVRPGEASPEYGYVQVDEELGNTRRITDFVEKPEPERARRFLETGYFWNLGNFLFRPQVFLNELGRLEPELLNAANEAHASLAADLDFMRLGDAGYEKAKSISVGHAIMERTDRAALMTARHSWAGIRNWGSVVKLLPADENGNSVTGEVAILEGANNLVHSPGKLTALAGVDDLIVVTSPDSILVTSRTNSEVVKPLVEKLAREGRTEASEALQIFRPWGNYEQIDRGDGYQVKRITVKPGGILSLQKHRHRAEYWVVVQGEAEVTIGEMVKTLFKNQSVHIPLGEVHRMANRADEPLVLIEVQSGDYLGEDDIIRLEDNYNRSARPKGVMN